MLGSYRVGKFVLAGLKLPMPMPQRTAHDLSSLLLIMTLAYYLSGSTIDSSQCLPTNA